MPLESLTVFKPLDLTPALGAGAQSWHILDGESSEATSFLKK